MADFDLHKQKGIKRIGIPERLIPYSANKTLPDVALLVTGQLHLMACPGQMQVSLIVHCAHVMLSCINFLTMMEHVFTTYVRTKTVFKKRLKHLKDYDTVKTCIYELKKLDTNDGPLLFNLKRRDEIWYDYQGNFRALQPGPIGPSLLDKTKKREKVKAMFRQHRSDPNVQKKVQSVS